MLKTLEQTQEIFFKEKPTNIKDYSRKAIDNYALYNAVKLIDIDNIEYNGWLVPKGKDYLLLPFNTIWHTYSFKQTHIKAIYHLTNGVLIPKDYKD